MSLVVSACSDSHPRPVTAVPSPTAAIADSDQFGAIVEGAREVYGIGRGGERTSQNPENLPFRRYRCKVRCPASVASGSVDPIQVLVPLLQVGDRLISAPYNTRAGDIVIDLFGKGSFTAVRQVRSSAGSQHQFLIVSVNGRVRSRLELGVGTPQIVTSADRSQALVFTTDMNGRAGAFLVDVRRHRTHVQQLPGEWQSGCIEGDSTVLVGVESATVYRDGIEVAQAAVSEPAGCEISSRSFSLVTLKTENEASTTAIRTFDFTGEILWESQFHGLANVSTHPRSDLLLTAVGGKLRLWNHDGEVEASMDGVVDADLLGREVVILLEKGDVLWRPTTALLR